MATNKFNSCFAFTYTFVKSKLFCLLSLLFIANCSLAQPDYLPSWNEGHAKQAIVEFVKATTTPGKDYIASKDRIAVFDQDGTLWVEKPLYAQFYFAQDAIRALVAQHPEWKYQEPYQSILEGNLHKIQKFSLQDIEKIIVDTHANMSVDTFKAKVETWLKRAVHPRFQKPYTQLIYQPMLEVIQYLKTYGYKVYIVSGGGQDFIRTYSEKVYGIYPEHIIGSVGKVKYEHQDHQPILIKLPEVLFTDDKKGKPEAIHLIIGKRPIAAFGNSDGDQQMLEWSQTPNGKSLQLLIHHDDPIREYAYDRDSHVGRFSQDLMEEAKTKNWIIVSMKEDWKVIFPEET